MTADLSPVLILIVSGVVGLLLIPFGLPGTWVILLGILGYGWLTEFHLLREQIYAKVYHNPPVAQHGRLHLGNRPGLGLELNQAAVEEYTEA